MSGESLWEVFHSRALQKAKAVLCAEHQPWKTTWCGWPWGQSSDADKCLDMLMGGGNERKPCVNGLEESL